MQDLNDLALFAAVVKHKGFSAAARALNIPKSKLSKHVARLEEQLDVRLLERSTRKLRITEIGQIFYERCETILAGVEAAEAVVATARSEPTGTVRMAAPIGFTPMLSAILPDFFRRYPGIKLLISATNRRIDMMEERFDIALRARQQMDTDNQLIVKKLGQARNFLVASPALLERLPPVTIETLGKMPTLSMNELHPTDTWTMYNALGEPLEITHTPILGCSDFPILERAAIEGLGIAFLPIHLCERAIQRGMLVHVLPEWTSSETIVHLVFTSRHGILPAVRALIDYLAEHLPPAMASCREVEPRPARLEAAE
ncbi:LysR family transcriptional regulator [Pararhizobium sp.]|uniref:LysR family transcriptional regulator n=1 Tax=Pararhizobium sp. TaxID=1977563 RepID=UPI00271D01EE|nr:LysR family transcriptional regulator [Pararhizobium sp.]MDO9415847.1 LysR family transcriptional regulator [Pararhizobium sp.]